MAMPWPRRPPSNRGTVPATPPARVLLLLAALAPLARGVPARTLMEAPWPQQGGNSSTLGPYYPSASLPPVIFPTAERTPYRWIFESPKLPLDPATFERNGAPWTNLFGAAARLAVAADGTVFATSGYRRDPNAAGVTAAYARSLLHAIDGRTGALLWRAFTEAGNEIPPEEFRCADTTCGNTRGQKSAPLLLASGAVVVGGQSSVEAWAAPALPAGQFAPDDAAAPRLVWRVADEDEFGREWGLWGGPRAAPGGDGPLLEAFSGLAARDPADGRLLWRRFGCEVEAALGGRPCCPFPRKELGTFNVANCSRTACHEYRAIDTGIALRADGGAVFWCDSSNCVKDLACHAVRGDTGAALWSQRAFYAPGHDPVITTGAGNIVLSADEGVLFLRYTTYTPTTGRWLAALDARTGAVLWHTLLGTEQPLAKFSVAAPGLAIFCDSRSTLSAYDQATGARKWRRAITNTPRAFAVDIAPILGGDGTLYVASNDPMYGILALRAASGEELWRVLLRGRDGKTDDSPLGDMALAGDGALLVTSQLGLLYAVELAPRPTGAATPSPGANNEPAPSAAPPTGPPAAPSAAPSLLGGGAAAAPAGASPATAAGASVAALGCGAALAWAVLRRRRRRQRQAGAQAGGGGGSAPAADIGWGNPLNAQPRRASSCAAAAAPTAKAATAAAAALTAVAAAAAAAAAAAVEEEEGDPEAVGAK
jgi:outer membrane protein assembly factor BamB